MAPFVSAVLFVFLISFQAFATNVPGVNNVFQFGGGVSQSNVAPYPAVVIPKPSGVPTIFTLIGGKNVPSAANDFQTLVKVGIGTTQYQVNANKTLVCYGFTGYASNANVAHILFGYGTAALAAADTATVPTGAQYYGSTSTASDSPFRLNVNGNDIPVYYPVPITFPASSFPFFRSSNGGGLVGVTMQCEEF